MHPFIPRSNLVHRTVLHLSATYIKIKKRTGLRANMRYDRLNETK